MKILLGTDQRNQRKVVMNTDTLTNAHSMIIGGSGDGKTFTIRGFIKSLALQPGARCVIFDVHGDIFPNDPDVDSISISETSPVGLQPFVISQDEEFGGVAKTIKRFISTINTNSGKIGTQMEGALRRMLVELYWKNGFYVNDPKTWSLDYDPWPGRPHPKRYPTFDDLIRFAQSKQKQIFLGTGSESTKALEAFIKKSSAFNKKRIKGEAVDETELNNLKQAALEKYEAFLDANKDEKVVETLLKYYSKGSMDAIINRLEALHFTGIFKDTPPVFDPRKSIHRYDLSTLDAADQKIFIHLKLADIFVEAKKGGIGQKAHTFVFIDEVKNFLDDSDSNMISKMYNEARKFGIGMCTGGQNISHFTNDMITNSSTKIILGIDRMYSKALSQKLHIDQKMIDGIVPKQSILVELKTHDKKSEFIPVELPTGGVE